LAHQSFDFDKLDHNQVAAIFSAKLCIVAQSFGFKGDGSVLPGLDLHQTKLRALVDSEIKKNRQ
jgi:hypothetical protein